MVTNPITQFEDARALKAKGPPVNVLVDNRIFNEEYSNHWIDLQNSGSHLTTIKRDRIDCRGLVPESWACIDCDFDTAPGCSNRIQLEHQFAANWGKQGVMQTIDELSEVYTVKPSVWKAARIDGMGGCLCIGCLERRLGRPLTPKDFARKHPLNSLPGTARLRSRRDGFRPSNPIDASNKMNQTLWLRR